MFIKIIILLYKQILEITFQVKIVVKLTKKKINRIKNKENNI